MLDRFLKAHLQLIRKLHNKKLQFVLLLKLKVRNITPYITYDPYELENGIKVKCINMIWCKMVLLHCMFGTKNKYQMLLWLDRGQNNPTGVIGSFSTDLSPLMIKRPTSKDEKLCIFFSFYLGQLSLWPTFGLWAGINFRFLTAWWNLQTVLQC